MHDALLLAKRCRANVRHTTDLHDFTGRNEFAEREAASRMRLLHPARSVPFQNYI
jgi:hypothetical protein